MIHGVSLIKKKPVRSRGWDKRGMGYMLLGVKTMINTRRSRSIYHCSGVINTCKKTGF